MHPSTVFVALTALATTIVAMPTTPNPDVLARAALATIVDPPGPNCIYVGTDCGPGLPCPTNCVS